MNKNQQNSTVLEVEATNNETGLTPIQEKAVMLLVSGKNITDVSNELSIDRGTLYKWFEKLAFKAYYNRCCKEIKESIQNSIFGMYNDAIQALKDSLKSDNEAVKLKAAFWLIEHLKNEKIGETNPKDLIKNVCTTPQYIDLNVFDEVKFKELCKENGLLS